ncbi:TrkH family potassium uptake protein [Mycoplasmopsis meleagridis]|uniref:TrkH family potassium uptake protein n=1 Tax=Mycoplasmopsis meleagridis TaxID=29561 RepID=UPI00073D750F|nr:potassium transporter TrkG [Mycoplasmopsis meleagridis]KUH47300.1 potassium transporter KtrB [Mycoplasmopsis meleagridis]
MWKWKFSRWLSNNIFAKIFAKFKAHRKHSNKIRLIFLTYLIIVIVSSLLLMSPITHQKINSSWGNVNFIDALFTASSAFSDTGLTSLTTYKTWNIFGQSLISILILIGGLGVFALKIYIINILFFGKLKISLNALNIVDSERSSNDIGKGTREVIIDSISTLLIIMLIGAVGLSFYFYLAEPRNLFISQTKIIDPETNLSLSKSLYYNFVGDFINPKGNWALSFRFGFFHAISALNNAGFDIIGNSSLMPYYHNIELQLFFLILFFIGGIGYPVIHDIINFFRFKIKHPSRKYHWKLLTKLSLISYLLASLIGAILVVTFEILAKNGFWWTNSNDINKITEERFFGNNAEKTWALIFSVFSTRSAGFATIPINHLSDSSLVVLSILMFIGAGPSSTGGGIRTTTFAIITISIFSRILGRPSVRAFHRKIDNNIVKNSYTVFLTGIVLLIITSLVISSSSANYFGNVPANTHFSNYLFEASSAFGTTGITAGISANSNILSKIFLIIIMFIGQLGISSTILIWGKRRNYSYKYEYVPENVPIG